MSNDNVLDFPMAADDEVLDIDSMLDEIKEDNLTQIVIFGINGEGDVLVYGSHGPEETDNLIDDGVEEWERMMDFDGDEEGVHFGE